MCAYGSRKVVPVHVHIMAAEIEGDKELEDERILWIDRREIAEQTTRRRPNIIDNRGSRP